MEFAIVFWLALVGGTVAALAWARKFRRTSELSSIALVVSTFAWLAAKVAIADDYRDADGYADCWPSCSVTQRAVAVGFVGGGC